MGPPSNSLKMKENQLFWTREVYERIMFQQPRSPREPKGKGKGKGKGKTKSVKGVHQDHLKPSPSGQKGGGKFGKGQSKGGRPSGWPTNWALQSPTQGLPSQAFLPRQLQPITCMPSQGQRVDLQWGSPPRQVHQQRKTLNPPGTWRLQPTGAGERGEGSYE